MSFSRELDKGTNFTKITTGELLSQSFKPKSKQISSSFYIILSEVSKIYNLKCMGWELPSVSSRHYCSEVERKKNPKCFYLPENSERSVETGKKLNPNFENE